MSAASKCRGCGGNVSYQGRGRPKLRCSSWPECAERNRSGQRPVARASDPDFVPSLRLLVERERYSLHDIGMMFDVSRERVRQWCERNAIVHPDDWRGLHMVRVWDDYSHRFVPITRPRPKQEFCVRGHRLAETRRPYGGCRECIRIRAGVEKTREQLADERRARDPEIVRRYLAGEGYRAIARDIGITPLRCYQIICANGVPRRRQRRPDQSQSLSEGSSR
jgi:hypothetical protein